MFMFFNLMLICILISTALGAAALLLGKKPLKGREKPSPFECGFSPFNSTRFPFSLRFFIITLLFLIFEVEIALILPIGATNNLALLKTTAPVAVIIMVILLLGLVHEWTQGVIKWSL